MNIRTATQLDRDAIDSVHWAAFAEDEREIVSKMAVDLLLEETSPKTVSLVADLEGNVVGHVAFSPVSTEADATWKGFILGPLGVIPDYQNQRVGTQLVESGLQKVSGMGADVAIVYGDPKYYSKFGFSAEAARQYIPPYKLKYPYGWQALALREDKARTAPAKIVVVSSLCDPSLW